MKVQAQDQFFNFLREELAREGWERGGEKVLGIEHSRLLHKEGGARAHINVASFDRVSLASATRPSVWSIIQHWGRDALGIRQLDRRMYVVRRRRPLRVSMREPTRLFRNSIPSARQKSLLSIIIFVDVIHRTKTSYDSRKFSFFYRLQMSWTFHIFHADNPAGSTRRPTRSTSHEAETC